MTGQNDCRGERIRTSGLVVPNDARYRAALHPEINQRTKLKRFSLEGHKQA